MTTRDKVGRAAVRQAASGVSEPVVTQAAERYVMSGSRAPRLVIKEGELFLCTDVLGQMHGGENSFLGLYHQDTRFLSRCELSICGRQPVLLSSTSSRCEDCAGAGGARGCRWLWRAPP